MLSLTRRKITHSQDEAREEALIGSFVILSIGHRAYLFEPAVSEQPKRQEIDRFVNPSAALAEMADVLADVLLKSFDQEDGDEVVIFERPSEDEWRIHAFLFHDKLLSILTEMEQILRSDKVWKPYRDFNEEIAHFRDRMKSADRMNRMRPGAVISRIEYVEEFFRDERHKDPLKIFCLLALTLECPEIYNICRPLAEQVYGLTNFHTETVTESGTVPTLDDVRKTIKAIKECIKTHEATFAPRTTNEAEKFVLNKYDDELDDERKAELEDKLKAYRKDSTKIEPPPARMIPEEVGTDLFRRLRWMWLWLKETRFAYRYQNTFPNEGGLQSRRMKQACEDFDKIRESFLKDLKRWKTLERHPVMMEIFKTLETLDNNKDRSYDHVMTILDKHLIPGVIRALVRLMDSPIYRKQCRDVDGNLEEYEAVMNAPPKAQCQDELSD